MLIEDYLTEGVHGKNLKYFATVDLDHIFPQEDKYWRKHPDIKGLNEKKYWLGNLCAVLDKVNKKVGCTPWRMDKDYHISAPSEYKKKNSEGEIVVEARDKISLYHSVGTKITDIIVSESGAKTDTGSLVRHDSDFTSETISNLTKVWCKHLDKAFSFDRKFSDSA